MYWNCTPTAEPSPRILVVRLGAMGDVIHTLPAVADLRASLPAARISWLIDSRWKELLDGNPSIDEAIPIPLGRWRKSGFGAAAWSESWSLLKQIRAREADAAIDFQGLLKSAVLAGLSGARRVSGFEPGLLREPLAGLLYDGRSGTSCRHVVDRNRALAAQVSGVRTGEPAAFTLPPGELKDGLPGRYVLASPQAGWGSKQWPAEHFARLAARIWQGFGIPLVADCAPGQEGHVEEIRRTAPAGAVVVHASTIPQLIGATRAATAVVGVDSGPLHLAAAIGAKGIAVFGPTDPARNGPYCAGIDVLRDERAATTYKRGAYPSDSMRACTPDRVYEALSRVLCLG